MRQKNKAPLKNGTLLGFLRVSLMALSFFVFGCITVAFILLLKNMLHYLLSTLYLPLWWSLLVVGASGFEPPTSTPPV